MTQAVPLIASTLHTGLTLGRPLVAAITVAETRLYELQAMIEYLSKAAVATLISRSAMPPSADATVIRTLCSLG